MLSLGVLCVCGVFSVLCVGCSVWGCSVFSMGMFYVCVGVLCGDVPYACVGVLCSV